MLARGGASPHLFAGAIYTVYPFYSACNLEGVGNRLAVNS